MFVLVYYHKHPQKHLPHLTEHYKNLLACKRSWTSSISWQTPTQQFSNSSQNSTTTETRLTWCEHKFSKFCRSFCPSDLHTSMREVPFPCGFQELLCFSGPALDRLHIENRRLAKPSPRISSWSSCESETGTCPCLNLPTKASSWGWRSFPVIFVAMSKWWATIVDEKTSI